MSIHKILDRVSTEEGARRPVSTLSAVVGVIVTLSFLSFGFFVSGADPVEPAPVTDETIGLAIVAVFTVAAAVVVALHARAERPKR